MTPSSPIAVLLGALIVALALIWGFTSGGQRPESVAPVQVASPDVEPTAVPVEDEPAVAEPASSTAIATAPTTAPATAPTAAPATAITAPVETPVTPPAAAPACATTPTPPRRFRR